MDQQQEFEHGMTDGDIAALLADAADLAEVGTAPAQAVLRGGRRRRARRWAVAAATAVVVAGSTGALAVTALPGQGDHEVTPATQQPTQSALWDENYFKPAGRTNLASGIDRGRPWQVDIDVWPAPQDEDDARAMMGAMAEYSEYPADIGRPSDLVGRSAYFVRHSFGQPGTLGTLTTEATTTAADRMSGTDIEVAAVPLDPDAAGGPQRLAIGHVAKTARQVTCTWKDGTSTKIGRDTDPGVNGTDFPVNEPAIRDAEGSPYSWFVCLAPHGTAFGSAEVTR
ncbi:hypothetical protein [Streptomyces sp. NPDC093094]|uniref:hypothetical protein n=1 Tax=Streptomyces sp. NPDC093094 TaxID=3366026 RepID=UPI0037FAE81F